MSYLLDAMIYLGIYYTPLHLGYSIVRLCSLQDGKTRTIAGNPPFRGGNQVIENSPADNSYIYRQDPKDERVVMRRPNQPHARWQFWLRRNTVEEARRELLQLQGKPFDPSTLPPLGGSGQASSGQAVAQGKDDEQEPQADEPG